MKHRCSVRTVIALVLLFAALNQPWTSRAFIWTVMNTADSGAGSFRDAVLNSGAGDTIRFLPKLTGTISLSSEIFINHTLFIQGPGPANLILSGMGLHRVFLILGGDPVLLSGLTIRDGLIQGTAGTDGGQCVNGTGGGGAYGGAIYATNQTLIISNCWVVGNTVNAGWGGQGGDNPIGWACDPGKGADGGDALGGALYSLCPSCTLVRCTFSDNRAIAGGGGRGGHNNNFAANVVANDGGKGGRARGGAVDLSGTANAFLINCTFSGNSVIGGTGADGGTNAAMLPGGNGGNGGNGECGGAAVPLNQSTKSCTIVSNSATGAAGGAGGFGLGPGIDGIPGGGYAGGLGNFLVGCVGTIGNTIVADNFASTARSNLVLQVSDLGFNYFGDDDGLAACGGIGTGTRVGTVAIPLHPQLGPLAQYGGGLPTHEPLMASPVIDTGHSLGLATDERRAPRPYGNPAVIGGDGSDTGAFEFGSTPLGMIIGGGTNGTGTQIVITWPAAFGNFTLQSSSNLLGGWSSVTDAPVVVDDLFMVTNTASGAGRFYRLIHGP